MLIIPQLVPPRNPFPPIPEFWELVPIPEFLTEITLLPSPSCIVICLKVIPSEYSPILELYGIREFLPIPEFRELIPIPELHGIPGIPTYSGIGSSLDAEVMIEEY
jgi:hypothetical protein